MRRLVSGEAFSHSHGIRLRAILDPRQTKADISSAVVWPDVWIRS